MDIDKTDMVICPDADPVNENWLRIIKATRENRPHDIVKLSGGAYTLEEAYEKIKQQQQYDVEKKRLELLVKPFAHYPGQGRHLLGSVGNGTCRHDYGLRFMRITGQTACAYCGLDFAANYCNWLQMALDHVIPTRTGTAKCIPTEWLNDTSNKVLACGSCNGFQNRYKLSDAELCPASLELFYQLRDRVFTERKTLVEQSHGRERKFFDQKPWVVI
jgi:5-methylcytosine-specific restriction endonuclease McrA